MVNTPKIETVIMIAVSLMVVAIIIPLAIGLVSVADLTTFNYTGITNSTTGETGQIETTLGSAADPSVITILTVLLPIVAIIGILMYYIPKR
jgi:hypothetical protein